MPAVSLEAGGRRYLFDGSGWWMLGSEGRPVAMRQEPGSYCGPLLLSLSLEGEDGPRHLLLWRFRFSRERWRRLVLAARYGAGLSTVSTAWGASSG